VVPLKPESETPKSAGKPEPILAHPLLESEYGDAAYDYLCNAVEIYFASFDDHFPEAYEKIGGDIDEAKDACIAEYEDRLIGRLHDVIQEFVDKAKLKGGFLRAGDWVMTDLGVAKPDKADAVQALANEMKGKKRKGAA